MNDYLQQQQHYPVSTRLRRALLTRKKSNKQVFDEERTSLPLHSDGDGHATAHASAARKTEDANGGAKARDKRSHTLLGHDSYDMHYTAAHSPGPCT